MGQGKGTLIATRLDRIHQSGIISLNENNHHNTYSFDCSTAVFIRQKYKCTVLKYFYGGRIRRSWGRG